MLKSPARATRRCLITRLTSSRCVTSCEALYCATTLFKTSLTIEGKTFSSFLTKLPVNLGQMETVGLAERAHRNVYHLQVAAPSE